MRSIPVATPLGKSVKNHHPGEFLIILSTPVISSTPVKICVQRKVLVKFWSPPGHRYKGIHILLKNANTPDKAWTNHRTKRFIEVSSNI